MKTLWIGLSACCLVSCASVDSSGPPAVGNSVSHPLDALTADEIRATVAILRAAGRIDDTAKFATLTLKEDSKDAVRAWRAGSAFVRRAFVVLMQGGRVYEADVNIGAGKVEGWRVLEGKQPRVLASDFAGGAALAADPQWQAALRKRGYVDGTKTLCAPLTPGPALEPAMAGRRILYFSCYDIGDPQNSNPFGRPIEGLMGVVDTDTREVLKIVDLGVVPLPPGPSSLSYESSARQRPQPKRVEIAAARGGNLQVRGSQIQWDNWRFHLRLDQRVGTVLSLATYEEQGAARDVLYQLSVSEMFVPYMDPAATWSWKAYMDVGEYGFGVLASRLLRGADCPASARFFDETIAGENGEPLTLQDVVCVFERPTGGPAWRHVGTGSEESRPDVELVVRMAPVVGNYDYIIDYVFNRAGEIEVRAGATGIDAVKAVAAQSLSDPTAKTDTEFGTLIAKGLVGINHDHYISFRIDADVDGTANRAVFDGFAPQGLPADNPRRSLWTVNRQTIAQEGPVKHLMHGGFLRIESTARQNFVGYPTSYQLAPGHTEPSLLAADDPIQARAGWSQHPVWLSRYAADELYTSGAYPNGNAQVEGLTQWTEARQSLDGQDIVLWYNVGFRHITRAEDWPAMPVVWHSFRLRPFNFFDRSPAMDIPPLHKQQK